MQQLPRIDSEMAVKNNADAIRRRVSAMMSAMPVIACMRCRTPGVVAIMPRFGPAMSMTMFLRPVLAMPIAAQMTFGSGVMAVFVAVAVVPLTLVPLFGAVPVVPTAFSGPGQYGRAAAQQCGT